MKIQAVTDNIFVWKRFIDDIFNIWTASRTEQEDFIHEANEFKFMTQSNSLFKLAIPF